MAPSRSESSRSRLKLKTSLPSVLTLASVLLVVRPIESTPNSRFLQAPSQRSHHRSDNFNGPVHDGGLATPSAAAAEAAIQNATSGEKLLELIGQQARESTERDLNDLLWQQTAGAGHQPDLSGASAQVVMLPDPELAQSTAAGTVAGLRVAQDLMALANRVEQSPSSEQEGDEQLMGPMDGLDVDDGDGDSSESGPADEADQQNRPDDSYGADDLQLKQAARRQMENADRTQQVDEADAQSAEPLNENQMPDSIESLMGADLDGADEGQAEDQSSAGETAGQQQQQQQQPAGSVPLQMTRQLDGPAMAEELDHDAEQEDDNERLLERQHAAYAQAAKTPAMFEAPPVELAEADLRSNLRGGRPLGAASPELDHNLVAPMRDSLEDLNVAAGHYYGKKKKKGKKVKKKIVIKKKKMKKKKKKYVKVKKIKYVKVKKVKKGKKYHPKKHHHGHDHGKYYMYAKVPKKKAWEFGFKKGNKKHWISRHEKGYKNKFKTKVKWADKKSKGKGFHVWDYNHHDKKKKGHY